MSHLTGSRQRLASEPAKRAVQIRLISWRAGGCSFAAAVTLEGACRGEFAELVPDHVFLDEDPDELVAVVHFEGVPNEFRDDRASPRPGLERLLGTVLIELGHLA